MAVKPRVSIPRRIFLGFALVLTVSGLTSVASFVQHERSAALLSLVHQGYLPLAMTISEAQATQSVFDNLLERVLSERDTTATRGWLNAARRIRPTRVERALSGIARVEELAPAAAERATLATLRRELKRVQNAMLQGEERYENLYRALDADDKATAQRILADLRARERTIDARLRRAWSTIHARIEKNGESAAAQQKQAMAVLTGLVAFALVVGVLITWWSQRVLSPLPKLQERVEAVARGDLAQIPVPRSDDEIGRLAEEFERMVAALAARDASLREASRSLRDLQQMQAQILADLSAAVLVVDGAGVLRSKNPAADRLFGLGPDALDASLAAVGLSDRLEPLQAAIAEVAAGSERVVLSEVPLLKGPETRLNLIVTPFGSGTTDATRAGVLVVAEDVTEELRTKTRLIQSERLAAIGRMAAHVTHEVRNPLSSIGLNVEMLEEELASTGQETRDLLKAIHREIDSLTAVTEEYLRLARLPNPRLEPEHIGDIAQSTAQFLRPELERGRVQLGVEVQEGLPLVAMDENQIRQVLLNLLKNAREAMPDGGKVTLQVRATEDGVVVRISDDGPGMDEEQRERIFDLFYTTKKLGTGLGLPLTQQIVLAHGGYIRCQSAPGAGTTFELWFPPAESPAQERSPVLAAAGHG